MSRAPGMGRSASRRTSRDTRSVSSKSSGRLNCAHAVWVSGWKRRATASIVWRGAGDERLDLGEGKRCGRVRDGEHLGPRLALAGPFQPREGSARSPSARRASRVGPPPHQPQQRPCQQAEHGSRDRPHPDMPALPQPHACRARAATATEARPRGRAASPANSAAARWRISCLRISGLASCARLRLARATLRLPQPRRKSLREGAAHLVGRRSQAAALIGEPYAGGLADRQPSPRKPPPH